MSQAINLRATQWAYEQTDLSVTAKAVLMTFAMHANERGYTWPGVDHIASTWRMDRKTVRRQIELLLASRKIFHTKKRCGYTGQVKLYRLPKMTWGSGGKSTRLQKGERWDRAGRKSPISGGGFPPNKEQGTQNTLEVRSTSWEEQHTNTHTHSSADFDLSLNGLTESQRSIVAHYQRTLVPKGWYAIDELTPKLKIVLTRSTSEELRNLIGRAAKTSPDQWPQTLSLVSLYWQHRKEQKPSRNGAPKTSKPISIAQRNKIINRLNDRKACIMRAFPDGRYEPWAVGELAKIQRQLEKL